MAPTNPDSVPNGDDPDVIGVPEDLGFTHLFPPCLLDEVTPETDFSEIYSNQDQICITMEVPICLSLIHI